MLTAPVSVAPKPENVDTASLKVSGVGSVGDFQSLLDIGINQNQPTSSHASTQHSSDDNNNNQNNQDQSPVAAAIVVPVAIVSAPPVKHAQTNISQNHGNVDGQDNNNDHNPSATTNTKQDAASSQAQNPATGDSAKNASTQAQASDDKDDADSQTAPKKQLHSSLQDQLGNIDQILLAITQALAGTSAPAAAASATPVIDPTAASTAVATDATSLALAQPATAQSGAAVDAASLLLPQALTGTQPTATDVAALSLPAPVLGTPEADIANSAALSASATDVSGSNVTAAISILKDLQSLMQQMQQNLQGTGNPQPAAATPAVQGTPAASNTDNLDKLAQMMQQDAAQLSQLLSKTSGNNNSQTTPAATAIAVTADATALTQTPAGDATAAAQTSTTVSTSISNNAQPVADSALTLVPQAPASDATTAPVIASDTAQSPIDLTALLKTGISEIKVQLQKLKNDNESQLAQAKLDLQAAFMNAKQFFKDSSGTADATATAASSPASVALTATASTLISTDQPVAAANPLNMNQSLIATASIIDTVQSISSSSTDANSGDSDQGQNASQPVISAGLEKAPAAPAAGSASFSKILSGVSSGSVIEQVTFQVKTAQNDGSSKISIQLDPTELGKVEIKLNVGTDGKTNVIITADNRNTLSMLQNDAQGLARSLTDAGLSTDSSSLSFNLRGDQQGQGQNQGGNAQAALTYQQAQPDTEEDVAIYSTTESYTVNLSGGLDISI